MSSAMAGIVSLSKGVVLSLGMILLLAAAPSKPDSISSIKVDVIANGLPGEHWEYHEAIQRQANAYVTGDGVVVEPRKIAALASALRRPVRKKINAVDFGFTSAWLRAYATRAFTEYLNSDDGNGEGFYTKDQRAFYIHSFSDQGLVEKALDRYYRLPKWLDDFVQVEVSIHFESGREVTISSDQQRPVMLPWTVTQNGSTSVTYDPTFSEAIQGLAPKSAFRSVLREDRLDRSDLLAELPKLVGGQVSDQWKRIPKFNVKPLVSDLEHRYSVQISHGGSEATSPTGLAWNAGLTWGDLPKQVSAEVTLPIVENTIRNTEAIPAARAFTNTAIAIPWVRASAMRPDTKLQVLIENGSGTRISDATRTKLLSDLRAIGQGDLAKTVAPLLDNAFVVMFDEPKTFSQWVILPDNRAILWDYYDAHPTPSILDLSAEQLNGKTCSDGSELCSGIVRMPDGTLQK